MKKQLLSLCFIVTLLVACNDSDDFTPEIDVTTTHTVSCREQLLKIPVTSNTDWMLIKESYRWCVPDKMQGSGSDTLILRIAENIDYKERKFSIGIGNPSVSKIIQITQQAATEEYRYKLPVIFHILYDDPSNPQQNVTADVITKAIEDVNTYYRNSVNSVDMNVEFVLATHDPQGNLLKEPGIERIYSDSPTEMSYNDFMYNSENTLYLWDLNRYINVFTFPFIEERMLGVSSVPFTIGYDPLVGLYDGDVYIDYPTLDFPHCIALNNHYILTEHLVLKVPDVHITLTHELGHYLGLFHVFEEDYCEDTETYDREAYIESLSKWETPSIEDLVKRTSYTGSAFVSYNIMDYDYSYLNQFTPNQRKRVRHVLENSPLIPGPKHTDYRTRSTRSTEIPKQRFVD
ncbi:MAG: zinc-dependent metalloproteinase lipoprotein [Lachnospiraceae bacterium]